MKVRISLVVVLVLASCSTTSSRTSTLELTSAPYASNASNVSNDEAALQVMTARCDRAIQCKNVGSRRAFVNRDSCAEELGREVQAELRHKECAGGVDRNRLATCLALARHERCGSVLDSVDRETSCRRDTLCPP